MTTAELLQLVEQAFPYLPRPAPTELPFHSDACAHCELMVRELLKYPGPDLPGPAIRFLCDEQSALSAKATAWVLPSYLRFVLTSEDPRDPRPTEFLIYNLSPSPEHADEVGTRLLLLSLQQIRVLMSVVEYWKRDSYWSDYCGDDLGRADVFLQTLVESRGRRTRG